MPNNGVTKTSSPARSTTTIQGAQSVRNDELRTASGLATMPSETDSTIAPPVWAVNRAKAWRGLGRNGSISSAKRRVRSARRRVGRGRGADHSTVRNVHPGQLGFRTISVNVSASAGKRVTFSFEQDDNGVNGVFGNDQDEQRYYDDIRIVRAG